MNTKSLLARIGVPVLSLGLLGGVGATLATSASASTVASTMASVKAATVTANTHLNNHPDTTNGSGGGSLVSTPGGAVWAYDNETTKFTVTSQGGNQYLVSIDIVGSFHGFADPGANGTTDPTQGYGAPLTSDGSVKGTITYEVTATQAPDASLLPGQSPSDAHLSTLINQLFGGSVVLDVNGNPLISQVGDYSFSYQNGNYVQAATITGDVNGH
jgi:hypothetical protein